VVWRKITTMTLDETLSKLGEVYFLPRPIEKKGNGALYKRLGIQYFKKGIVACGDIVAGKKNNPYRYRFKRGNLERDLRLLDDVSRGSEFIHSLLVPVLGYQTIEGLAQGDYKKAAAAGIFTVLNAYCSMTQRYHRTRIYGALEKIKS